MRTFVATFFILFSAFLLSPFDSSAQIKLAWNPNTEPDLAGYRVYYGTAPRTYGAPIDVGNVTTCTVPGLAQGVTYYFAVTAYDTTYKESAYSAEVSGMLTATAPETVSAPSVLRGPTNGVTGGSYTYTAGGSSSSQGDPVEYQFDWKGDGTNLSPWGSASQSKTWTSPGIYYVRARARCAIHTGAVSSWIGPIPVTISQTTPFYTVTTNPSGLQITVDGTSYTAPRSFNWPSGSTHTLSVTSPQSGAAGTRFVYSSWSQGGSQTQTVTTPSTSTIYTANFTTQYALTTSVTPSGGGTVNPSGTNWYAANQSVSVRATPNAGYAFLNWSGELSGSTNPISITMSGAKNVTANFSQGQYAFNIYINPSSSGVVSRNPAKSTYVYGDQVTLTATPNSGFAFNNWTGSVTGTTNTVILTINGNQTVTANFSLFALLAPQGGVVIPSGSLYTIRWNAPSQAVRFRLLYSTDNAATWNLIADGIRTTSYNWQVPTPLANKRECFVGVTGYDASGAKVWSGTSSAFTIEVVRLTSYNGGETLTSKSTGTIRWTTNRTQRPVASVDLYYTNDGGVKWNLINSRPIPGNPGSYDWVIPPVAKPKSECKVRVVLKDAGGISLATDASDGYFTIQPQSH